MHASESSWNKTSKTCSKHKHLAPSKNKLPINEGNLIELIVEPKIFQPKHQNQKCVHKMAKVCESQKSLDKCGGISTSNE